MTHGVPCRRSIRRLLVLAACLWTTLALPQDLQIIELKHRMASDLLPVVQPLVEPGGVVTGTDNLLIVRASAKNFAQIQQAVATLDRAPRQLLITVRQGNDGSDDSLGVRGSASVGSGSVQGGVNQPPTGDTEVQVQSGARTLRTVQGHTGSVRVLEGNEAWIGIGQSRPVTTTSVSPGWHGPIVTQDTQYRDAQSGFYATARVNGERVALEISPQQQAFRSRGSIDTQGLTTTVAGRLGEWIPLGAVRNQQTGSTSGPLVWGTRSSDSEYSAWVKVDEIP